MQHLAKVDRADMPAEDIDKWEVLRALATARRRYGLSDRDLSVLQALLSFHPDTVLEAGTALVVHPSNRAICARLNGMPCSTMRRHLARLVAAGVLLRRDSPNGKRYARHHDGQTMAYGFDLRPLLCRFAEFRAAAEEIATEEAAIRHLRETASLMRRDLAALATFGEETRPDLPLWDRLSDLAALTARDLRRKLALGDLRTLNRTLQSALAEAMCILDPDTEPATSDSSTGDARNEHHHQNSEKESIERGDTQSREPEDVPQGKRTGSALSQKTRDRPTIPLQLVLETCREIQTYLTGPVRHWHDLVRAAQDVSPMMGISRSAWEAAVSVMGFEHAAITVAAMLERLSEIRSPGGYLRRLVEKASEGRFSCGPMIAALRHRPLQGGNGVSSQL